MAGERFTTLPVRSGSSRPEDDTLYADMSSVGGKAGDNWRDAVDRDGNRYFLFEINRDHFPDHPTNPYQVWALSLTEGDDRGLLRVVPHPKATMTEFVTSQTGMTPQPSANWWNFAAGFPWSGDNAIVLLDYVEKLRTRGLERPEALVRAGMTRLRPVLLTAATTILGLIPMATGVSYDFRRLEWSLKSESSIWWGQMATAVIFGLAVATMLTLVIVPTMYSILDRMKTLSGHPWRPKDEKDQPESRY